MSVMDRAGESLRRRSVLSISYTPRVAFMASLALGSIKAEGRDVDTDENNYSLL